MPNVFFRDVLTGVRDEITVFPDNKLGDYLPAALLVFPIRFRPEDYELTLRGSKVNSRQTVRSLRLRNRETVDVEVSAAIRSPLETAAGILSALNKGKIVVFVGGGVSSDALDGKLSTSVVHYDFLHTLASVEPRTFDARRLDIQELLNAMDERKGSKNMLSFMNLFESVADLRARFVAHVIRACCLAQPNPGHAALLDLLDIISSDHPKVTFSVFTTNYDNLLEKTSRKYRVWKVTPEYETPKHRKRKGALAVIPLHGSVRISQCSGCGAVLRTQAAALGVRLCVYCGAEIPNIILPMEEGDINKEALVALETEVGESDVVLFVGYGFGDPHLRDAIARNLPKDARVVNLSRETAPEMLVKKAASVATVGHDLTLSMRYLGARMNFNRFIELEALREEDVRRFSELEGFLGKSGRRPWLRRLRYEALHRKQSPYQE